MAEKTVEYLDNRVGEVSIELDAAKAEIELKASMAEVNQAISEAQIDPEQIPIIDDLELRVSEVEILADANAGAISQFLAEAAENLASPEHEELRRELHIFLDMWGLESYTPPEHVEMRVREIVKGFLYAAQIAARQTEGKGDG